MSKPSLDSEIDDLEYRGLCGRGLLRPDNPDYRLLTRFNTGFLPMNNALDLYCAASVITQ